MRKYDYYTGVVFEGYAKGLGFPICGGGRYDKLLGKFGYYQPATGFALGLERILLALVKDVTSIVQHSRFLIKGNQLSQVLSKAEELRQKGYQVETDLSKK